MTTSFLARLAAVPRQRRAAAWHEPVRPRHRARERPESGSRVERPMTIVLADDHIGMRNGRAVVLLRATTPRPPHSATRSRARRSRAHACAQSTATSRVTTASSVHLEPDPFISNRTRDPGYVEPADACKWCDSGTEQAALADVRPGDDAHERRRSVPDACFVRAKRSSRRPSPRRSSVVRSERLALDHRDARSHAEATSHGPRRLRRRVRRSRSRSLHVSVAAVTARPGLPRRD
jgi:hypothetical protein